MPGLLDVVLLYDCNLACDYCTITPSMRLRSLSPRDVLAAMRSARADGYDRIAFTGGEPTLRPDLIGLVRAARKLGYGSVKVQSNGLVFASATNVEQLVSVGVDLFHVSIHRRDAAGYDRLVQRPGAHELMVAGVQNVVASGCQVVIDVILKSDTYRELPGTIEWLGELGVRAVDLWFVSLTDQNADNVASLPRMSDVVPEMARAFALGRDHGIRIRSLHVPRCLLGRDAAHAFDPGAQRVRVLTPDASFELSESRLAGNEFVSACEGCPHREVCPGLRPDYLDVYGDDEIALARGLPASRPPKRRLPRLERG